MTSSRVRPPNNRAATTWREVLLDEVLPAVDASGGERWPRSEGIIYFNARYYDPIVGRFLTEDPSRKGTGWYTYCENNPINRVDPTGMESAIDYNYNDQQQTDSGPQQTTTQPSTPSSQTPSPVLPSYQATAQEGESAVLGTYKVSEVKAGVSLSPATLNVNAAASSINFQAEQERAGTIVGPLKGVVGTGQKVGALETFAGITPEAVGVKLDATIAAVNVNFGLSLFGWGVRVKIELGVGAGAGFALGPKELSLGAKLGFGGTLTVQPWVPNN